MRHDYSVSTFNTIGPPQLYATLPTFPKENPVLGDLDVGKYQASSLQAKIPVHDYDRPLLDHFVDNVLRMIFPILEVHQCGSARAQSILQSLETNKSYFHCCLSVAAIHLKTTSGLSGEQIDHEIIRHRYKAISELCKALNEDADHEHILDATLAMIFFHCSVGAPDDHLPDIPWNDHFEAASNLVSKLDLTNKFITGPTHVVPPFSMSLTSWVDILGATMLGKTPQFAHSYRVKHLSGISSGFRELMGCDDRVMYLISEVACLESLKLEGRIASTAVHTHVSTLNSQLEYTEDADTTLVSPYSPKTGAILPDALTRTITAIFRIAARIYLCSLIPGGDRDQTSTINLVNILTDAMAYIPSGPFGFDRSLVWPLLIAGAFSTPSSSFRQLLSDRVTTLGGLADLGSIGRMYQLLNEYWRLSDDPVNPSFLMGEKELEAGYQSSEMRKDSDPSVPLSSTETRKLNRQQVDWRDVMNGNGWRYLLI
ncbi:transcriptional regulator family: Fungal Specific TF [Penicillium roqueforti]|nr:transcriptional regulator family: Fungal Specific TF [Penicillium roqueforti]KAI2734242.1 transcriptional regulator family: Fungal Specific TF [Penicillium roqueforti]KAI3152188.1 transcriptional regulator family: Fungal Specific TF [Penicillium roqueforti]KAI3207021.1 transcriptional regulator family: Fungal Specific TF [Penicillium roqueforti]